MSKNKPQLSALVASSQIPPQQKNQAKKKTKKKRFDVQVGDVVAYHTVNMHYFGTAGIVTDVLDEDRVVARPLALPDADYSENQIVLLRYKPTGTVKGGGGRRQDYCMFITDVISVREVAKEPKSPKERRVIDNHDALIEHLASDSKEKVVVVLPPAESAAVDAIADDLDEIADRQQA